MIKAVCVYAENEDDEDYLNIAGYYTVEAFKRIVPIVEEKAKQLEKENKKEKLAELENWFLKEVEKERTRATEYQASDKKLVRATIFKQEARLVAKEKEFKASGEGLKAREIKSERKRLRKLADSMKFVSKIDDINRQYEYKKRVIEEQYTFNKNDIDSLFFFVGYFADEIKIKE